MFKNRGRAQSGDAMEAGGAHGGKKKLRILAVLLLLAAAGGWYGVSRMSGDIRIAGQVESTLYTHICEVQGKVLEAPVEQGATVKKGDLLFRLDDTAQVYALEQLRLALVQKELAVTELEEGADAALLRQAQNGTAIALAAYDKAADEYARMEALYAEGAVPRTALDAAATQRSVAAAQLDSARQQERLVADGAGAEALEAARASAAQTESQIRQLEEALEKYKIPAAVDGVLVSKNIRAGDMAAPGTDLAEIAATGESYVVAYLPVDLAPTLAVGQILTVEKNDRAAAVPVASIDVKAQYTPKDLQTAATRNRDSVRLRLRLPPDAGFVPGEIVDIWIPRP